MSMVLVKPFENGKTYYMSCGPAVLAYEIVGRTEKTVLVRGQFIGRTETRRLRVKTDIHCATASEYVTPFGTYANHPVLRSVHDTPESAL